MAVAPAPARAITGEGPRPAWRRRLPRRGHAVAPPDCDPGVRSGRCAIIVRTGRCRRALRGRGGSVSNAPQSHGVAERRWPPSAPRRSGSGRPCRHPGQHRRDDLPSRLFPVGAAGLCRHRTAEAPDDERATSRRATGPYELDHLIPISLGGAPLDARDLWLQPRQGQANAGDKNVLAYVLWRLVCERQVPLATAQEAISRDWTKAHETYATPENVAKHHFRYRERED